MKRLPILLLLFIVSVHAQTNEYGSPSELRGVTRIFIDTGDDTKARDKIVKELEKSKIKIEVLALPDNAELFLSFASETSEQVSSVRTRPPAGGFPARSRVEYETTEKGKGVAFTLVNNRKRILFSWAGENNPAKSFASNFIKAYKKANDLK